MTPKGDGACWGRNPGGSVRAVWALAKRAPDQVRPQTRFGAGPKRDFLRPSPPLGRKSHVRRSRGHGARTRGTRGPRKKKRHALPRGPRRRATP
jgi:hypothetical protein